ncbi:STAS domain-containing protein [Mesobacillus harenae]|uniref:STAS domain-containing protein n=1 Tax=Mesobacillus harenae TaxID=2213203 RepID=UPI001580A364|nr:STAS domain-containing protein [Mesobacillus harenae]
MDAIGKIPASIPELNIINSIGENIIVADKDYNVAWVNPTAASLLTNIAPLFGMNNASEIIGMNMNHFHQNPDHQNRIMGQLEKSHRARINIKDEFVTDIIINPIYNSNEIKGYVVMLMDVTTKAEEESRREKLIEALSVPILKIWDKTIAIPLFGGFDLDRGELLLTKVLEYCTDQGMEYVLLDVTGLTEWTEETASYLKKLADSLKIIGSECIFVGMSPELAIAFAHYQFNYPTLSTTQDGLEYVLKTEKRTIL